MEAAAKDTLALQGSKGSEVYTGINGGNSEPNMKPKSSDEGLTLETSAFESLYGG